MRATLRLGTRRSSLARRQSSLVAEELRRSSGCDIELVLITTHGDRTDAPLHTLGGQGAFTSALREELLAKRIDFAVHSYKDLPTASTEDLMIAAVPTREDPRDALVARDGLTLAEFPAGARIGTGSVRRTAQLHAMGFGLEPTPLRGNVDSRLAKVHSGELDGVVLALSGLRRLGQGEAVTEAIDPIAMLPAAAQGALAVECRRDADDIADLLKCLDDNYSRSSVEAERALLATLEAGCSAPVGALAEIVEAEKGLEISLRASVTAADGSDAIRLSATGALTDAIEIGQRLARLMLEDGAAELMGSPR